MTENEAKIIIEGYLGNDEAINETIEIAGKALEETQRYREFETIFKSQLSDVAIDLLSDEDEFGKWLERIKWTTRKCDELMSKLMHYENLEQQGRMLIVPEIPKNKTLYWIWGNEIMPVTYKRITSCTVADDGKPYIMCEMITKKDRTFIHRYRRKSVEDTIKAGEKRYFYADDIGKTIFFTRSEAKEVLKN